MTTSGAGKFFLVIAFIVVIPLVYFLTVPAAFRLEKAMGSRRLPDHAAYQPFIQAMKIPCLQPWLRECVGLFSVSIEFERHANGGFYYCEYLSGHSYSSLIPEEELVGLPETWDEVRALVKRREQAKNSADALLP